MKNIVNFYLNLVTPDMAVNISLAIGKDLPTAFRIYMKITVCDRKIWINTGKCPKRMLIIEKYSEKTDGRSDPCL